MVNQVGDFKNLQSIDHKWNTYNTLRPIIRLLKLFAINCNVEHRAVSEAYIYIRNIFTVIILGIFSVYSLYFKIKYVYTQYIINISIQLTDSVQMIYDYCQYIVDLYFVYKYGRHISLEYFKQYESIDKIINMTYYSVIKWKLVKLIGFFTTIWVISSSFDFAAWFLGFGWTTPIVYSVSYIYLFIKILTILDLTSYVMHIEVRLKIIADLIQEYYLCTESLPGLIGDSLCNSNWLYPVACQRTLAIQSNTHPLKALPNTDCHEIKWLSRCYLLLTEQVQFVNRMYGFRILLNSLSLLIDMVRFTNIAVRMIIGTQHKIYRSGYFPVVSSLMRMLTCIVVLISLVHHCEEAYRQRNRIISITDHLLINKKPSKDLRAAILELSELVRARQISFSMADFFRLDKSLLASIASVVVTYSIILLQSMN